MFNMDGIGWVFALAGVGLIAAIVWAVQGVTWLVHHVQF